MAFCCGTIALVRERISGTLDRMLVATFRRGEIVLGYVVGFAALAAAQAVCVLAIIALLYDVPRLGARLPVVLAVVALLVIASIGLGLLVSSTARSEGQIFPFIRNNVVLNGERHGYRGDFRNSEFTGVTFSPDGRWMFFNIQWPGITFAVTGPWEDGKL